VAGTSIFLKNNDKSSSDDRVSKFLEVKGVIAGSGRLIFALDATASRAPTWDLARELTAGMIAEAGALELQLVFFRGGADGAPQCAAGPWTRGAGQLSAQMLRVTCAAGYTQIVRILQHAQRETLAQRVGAVVYIGDMCETVNDDPDRVAMAASALGKLRTPVFAFQEGRDPHAEKMFREIARLTGGAYGRFDAGGAKQLSEFMKAAATFAVGGVTALAKRDDAGSRLLVEQLKGDAT
jgi:hypothetical protein